MCKLPLLHPASEQDPGGKHAVCPGACPSEERGDFAACAPGADVGSFDVVTALALVQGPRPLAAHASPVHGLQAAGNCLLLSPDGVSELHH